MSMWDRIRGGIIHLRNPVRGRKESEACWPALVLLLLAIVCLEFFISRTVAYNLNSDDASELILSNLLAAEKRIITPDWYYSTELRVLNTQLVFAPLFLLTQNWHVVRVAGTAILHLVLLASCRCTCKALRCKTWFPFAALMLILPYSHDYYSVVLRVPYYIPHIAVSLVSFGLLIDYAREKNEKNTAKANRLLCVSILLAFLAGLGGMRQLAVYYLPLFLSVAVLALLEVRNGRFFWKDRGNELLSSFICSLLCLAGALSGVIINAEILSQRYHFFSYEIQFTTFNFERLHEVLAGFLITLGFRTGPIGFWTAAANAACAFYLAGTVYCVAEGLSAKRRASFAYRLLAMFVVCGFAVFILLYTLTDMSYVPRYAIPVLVFIAPLLAAGLSRFAPESGLRASQDAMGGAHAVDYARRASALIAGLWLLLTVLSSYGVLSNYSQWREGPVRKREVADALTAGGYQYGYATFWNANVFSELSDGALQVHAWCDGAQLEAVDDIDQTFQWLQLVSHDSEKPDGKVFLLLSREELERFPLRRGLRDEDMIFANDAYQAFGYDSYQELVSTIYDYVFDFRDSQWLLNGEDQNGARVIYPDGVSYGPYIKFHPGVYTISIQGENLLSGQYDATYEAGSKTLERKMLKQSDHEVIYRVEIPLDLPLVETTVRNHSSENIILSGILIDYQ